MILNNRDQWDAEDWDAVLHYAGGPKQSWDNTDITGPWLNVIAERHEFADLVVRPS